MSPWRARRDLFQLVRTLTDRDCEALLRLAEPDPVVNLFVLSRVEAYGVSRRSLGCDIYGYFDRTQLVSALHVGANVVPVRMLPDALPQFVDRLGPMRRASSIMGEREPVLELFRALGERWGDTWGLAREVRGHQPLLAIDHPPLVPPDARVVPITMRDFESYYDASVRMYTEEVGVSPVAGDPSSYRGHVRGTIETGRAFGIVENGRVIFKSDIGAMTAAATQVQGVWLEPKLRGRHVAAGAMAGVVQWCRQLAPVCSLYVNDFNAPARALYARVGFRQVGEFATVLY